MRRIATGLRSVLCGAGLGVAVLLPCAAAQTSASQDSPAQFDELAAQAAAARNGNDVARAIELYGRAAQLKPDWADGWWNLGMLQYGASQYGGAIEAFDHLLQLAPNAVPAIGLRGLCEFELGAYQKSLLDLGTAVARGGASDPRNEQILRYHLGQALTKEGHFQEALAQYKVFADHQVSSQELMVAVGLAGMRVQMLPGEVAPTDRDLYAAAGEAGYSALNGVGERTEALFQQLFARYPSTPNLHLFYGFLLYPNDPAQGATQFREELAVAPNNDAARALLAYTLMMAGRYAEAGPEAERALAGTPGMAMAEVALGRSLAETGHAERGTELLAQVLKDDPNNLEAHMGLAAIYSRAGRREDAYRERMLCLSLADK